MAAKAKTVSRPGKTGGAAAKKTKAPARPEQVVGEGDYAASRAFLKDQAGFVQKNKAKIPAMGKAARKALDGAEGAALMAAEAQAKGRARK